MTVRCAYLLQYGRTPSQIFQTLAPLLVFYGKHQLAELVAISLQNKPY